MNAVAKHCTHISCKVTENVLSVTLPLEGISILH